METDVKSQVSENLITKAHKVKIAEVGAEKRAIDIKLGMTVNMASFASNDFHNCIDIGGLDIVRKKRQFGDSYNKVIKGDNASLFRIQGSLDMNISVKVAEINGKAAMNLDSKTKNSEAHSMVRQIIEQYSEEIDLRKISKDKISKTFICKRFTHVVSKVIKGKRYEAELSLKDNSTDKKKLS